MWARGRTKATAPRSSARMLRPPTSPLTARVKRAVPWAIVFAPARCGHGG